jgi:hypothetical protein
MVAYGHMSRTKVDKGSEAASGSRRLEGMGLPLRPFGSVRISDGTVYRRLASLSDLRFACGPGNAEQRLPVAVRYGLAGARPVRLSMI